MPIYLLAWLPLLLNSIVGCDGIKCMQCKDLPHPELCGQVAQCSQDESCLVREYATTSGTILYTSDCIAQQRCAKMHRRGSNTEDSGRFDLDLCLDCCNSTDYCNIEGCGTKVTDVQQRGPYCFECSVEDGANGCRTVRRCPIGHSCVIEKHKFPGFYYKTGCRPEQECNAITQSNINANFKDHLSISLPYCCTGDFCNDILNFVNNVSLQVTAKPDGQTNSPVASHWSSWTDWSICSVTCGPGGLQSRLRTCIHPPQNTHTVCLGVNKDLRNCSMQQCPVNGAWSEWEAWSACTSTCDVGGRKTRYRKCNNPAPGHDGQDCIGSSKQTHSCSHPCPVAVNGAWSSWGPWSGCTVTCGRGLKTRQRLCNNPAPQHNGADCAGNPYNMTSRRCLLKPCPGDICDSLGKVGFTMTSNDGRRVCVTLSRTLATWRDARKRCKAEGGYLAIVNNWKMDAEVHHMLEGHVSPVHESAWIGVATSATDNTWHWVGPASALTYEHFHQGEASHDHRLCGLAHLETRTYDWLSVSCDEHHPYLCEFK